MADRGVVHATSADIQPCAFRPGGHWLVACLCGWEDNGRYARDTGKDAALRLASQLGARHEKETPR